jgi:putative DNA primase/helicase
MTAADLAARLRATRARGGWTARCPAHDDRRASLSIGTGHNGRVLLHCHAHCTPAAICTAAGLELRDLFPERTDQFERTVVATYDYHDEHGALLSQVVRFDPKGFRPRRPDGS